MGRLIFQGYPEKVSQQLVFPTTLTLLARTPYLSITDCENLNLNLNLNLNWNLNLNLNVKLNLSITLTLSCNLNSTVYYISS